jgi:hypothetical protein
VADPKPVIAKAEETWKRLGEGEAEPQRQALTR